MIEPKGKDHDRKRTVHSKGDWGFFFSDFTYRISNFKEEMALRVASDFLRAFVVAEVSPPARQAHRASRRSLPFFSQLALLLVVTANRYGCLDSSTVPNTIRLTSSRTIPI